MPKLLSALAGGWLMKTTTSQTGPSLTGPSTLVGLKSKHAKKNKSGLQIDSHTNTSRFEARSWIRIPSFLLSLKQVQQRTDLPTSLRSHRRLPRRNPRRRRRHRRRCWYDPRFLLLTLQNRSLPRTPPRAQSNPPKLLRISPGPSRAEPSGQV